MNQQLKRHGSKTTVYKTADEVDIGSTKSSEVASGDAPPIVDPVRCGGQINGKEARASGRSFRKMQSYHKPAINFLLRHLLYGSIGGLTLGLLILWFDLGGLATLIFASPEKYLFLAMLFFGLWITFGSIGMAVGIMNLGEERDSDPF